MLLSLSTGRERVGLRHLVAAFTLKQFLDLEFYTFLPKYELKIHQNVVEFGLYLIFRLSKVRLIFLISFLIWAHEHTQTKNSFSCFA